MKEPHPAPIGDSDSRPPQRPYRKPRLTEYGSIAKLTQGTRTSGNDGPGGGFKKTSCL